LLVVPDNVTLPRLPPYSPESNPVERVWLHLRERHVPHRVLAAATDVSAGNDPVGPRETAVR
jgi:hypothetical protein